MKTNNIKLENNLELSELTSKGYLVIDDFFTMEQCKETLNLIANYRQEHEVVEVNRSYKERNLQYSVINGQQVENYLPTVWQLYEKVNLLVNKVSKQNLVPLTDKMPTVNINIIKPGGEYRWHYDRNAITALLYLNTVAGGELEIYPKYRLGNKNKKFSWQQKFWDAVLKLKLIRNFLGNKVVIKPRQGMIVIMQGDRCLHSVKSLAGNQERINIVMAYDIPGKEFPVEQGLNSYLYTNQEQSSSDANYV